MAEVRRARIRSLDLTGVPFEQRAAVTAAVERAVVQSVRAGAPSGPQLTAAVQRAVSGVLGPKP